MEKNGKPCLDYEFWLKKNCWLNIFLNQLFLFYIYYIAMIFFLQKILKTCNPNRITSNYTRILPKKN